VKTTNGHTNGLPAVPAQAGQAGNGFAHFENGVVEKELYTKQKFPGRLLMLGCGAIGQGIIPMLLRHTDITPERMKIIVADGAGKPVADKFGIPFLLETLTPENYKAVLKKHLSQNDFLLNLSVDVSSDDLIEVCQKIGVLYVDTSSESWPGVVVDPTKPIAERTNYALDKQFEQLKKKYIGGLTALVNHGANPGLISHFVKAALLEIARDTGDGIMPEVPKTREGWAELMQSLRVRTIQVAERDTQNSSVFKQPDEFVNTWSVDGFLSEATQPVELGWGTHEKELPPDAHEFEFGDRYAIYLDRPGALTLVRSWTPREGPYHGYLITHDESLTIAKYYTVYDENNRLAYRPTVMYAYHPCDDAVLSIREYAGNNFRPPRKKRILMDEIEHGSDELGALLMGHKKRAYWYGSDLSIDASGGGRRTRGAHMGA
jgi:homospermidine synthase